MNLRLRMPSLQLVGFLYWRRWERRHWGCSGLLQASLQSRSVPKSHNKISYRQLFRFSKLLQISIFAVMRVEVLLQNNASISLSSDIYILVKVLLYKASEMLANRHNTNWDCSLRYLNQDFLICVCIVTASYRKLQDLYQTGWIGWGKYAHIRAEVTNCLIGELRAHNCVSMGMSGYLQGSIAGGLIWYKPDGQKLVVLSIRILRTPHI